jgi:hypothetical protein
MIVQGVLIIIARPSQIALTKFDFPLLLWKWIGFLIPDVIFEIRRSQGRLEYDKGQPTQAQPPLVTTTRADHSKLLSGCK